MNQYVIKEDIGRVVLLLYVCCCLFLICLLLWQGAYGQVKKVFDKQTQEVKVS